jgi:hypothetical protein
MRTAPEGTGIIAGGPMRAVFEMLGIKDVVAKSTGTQNPYNMIRATMDGLSKLQSPRQVASRRGKKVADILPKRDDAPAEPARLPRRPETHGKNHRRQADRLPDPPPRDPAPDADRPGPQQDAQDPRAGGHAMIAKIRPRHDRQDPASGGDRRRARVEIHRSADAALAALGLDFKTIDDLFERGHFLPHTPVPNPSR